MGFLYKKVISSGGGSVPNVITVNNKTGTNITLYPEDLGLGQVDNAQQVKRAEMAIPNGVATLDSNGKVPILQMNSQLAHVVSVPNKATRLALDSNSVLTVCLQADTQWMWALNAELSPSVETNWIDCGSTAASVISVNGSTGAVTISCDTLGAVPTGRKVNSKALTGDITLSLADIITLPNDPAKYLNGQGQWVKITSLSTAEAVELNWRDYFSEATTVNQNGDKRLWTYTKAYGIVLPSGSSHKITKLVWSQGMGYNFSGTGYIRIYDSTGTYARQSAGFAMSLTGDGTHVTYTLPTPITVNSGDRIFAFLDGSTPYPGARSVNGSTIMHSGTYTGVGALPISVPSLLTYNNYYAGFYFVMSYVPA